MSEQEEFRPVVQLLLARMESSPEEFGPTHAKYRDWSALYDDVDSWATEAEKAALYKAAGDIRMGELHSRAMRLILRDEQSNDIDPEETRYAATERYSVGYGDAIATNQSAINDALLQQTMARITGDAYAASLKNQNALSDKKASLWSTIISRTTGFTGLVRSSNK